MLNCSRLLDLWLPVESLEVLTYFAGLNSNAVIAESPLSLHAQNNIKSWPELGMTVSGLLDMLSCLSIGANGMQVYEQWDL